MPIVNLENKAIFIIMFFHDTILWFGLVLKANNKTQIILLKIGDESALWTSSRSITNLLSIYLRFL